LFPLLLSAIQTRGISQHRVRFDLEESIHTNLIVLFFVFGDSQDPLLEIVLKVLIVLDHLLVEIQVRNVVVIEIGARCGVSAHRELDNGIHEERRE